MAEMQLAEAEAPDTSAIAGLSDQASVGDEGLTQDAILDKYTEGRPQEEAPAETTEAPAPGQEQGKSDAEAKPVETKPEQAAEQAEAEAQGPLIPGVTPENVQKAFKSLQKWHPDAAKAIREAYFENKGYRETFTLPESRELRTMFDSVQAAKDARGAMADLMAADELIRNNPSALLQYVSKSSPEGFIGLATAVPELLYQASPELYKERVSGPAVKNYHDFFDAKAREVGNDDVVTAIQILREFEKTVLGDRAPRARQPQADPAIMAELNQLRAGQAQAQGQALNAFRDAVDTDFNTALQTEVTKIIDGSGADLSDAAKQDVVEDVLDEIKNSLLEDQVLQRRLDWSLQRGTHDQTHRQQLSEMLTANARRFLGPAASKYLGRMTKEILRANAGRLDKAATVQPTRNVGGAPPGTSGKQPLTKADIDKMSEDDIITAAAEGRL